MNRPRNIIEVRKLAVVSSAIFLTLFTAWFLLGGVWSDSSSKMGDSPAKYKFETVTGIFMQDDPETDWKNFDYTKTNFGLIPTSWSHFTSHLQDLLSTAPEGVTYKVLYMGRHGEGDHNVAEAFYGTEKWDDYWSKLEGNGSVIWADAHLTDIGKGQAQAVNGFLKGQFGEGVGMPVPERWIVSPMFRCLQTAELSWTGLDLPFQPVIKELLREVLGEHTCDRRSTKSYIHEHYPKWAIEDGFTEEDELWKADHRETWEEHDKRTQTFLEDLWENEARESVHVSLTSHSGAIASHLRVLGHREFRLPTGGMIPVLVKGTRVK